MVGKVAVVPIVLNVAVDVAGGGSVRNMSLQQNWKVRCVSLSSTLPPGLRLPLFLLFLPGTFAMAKT